MRDDTKYDRLKDATGIAARDAAGVASLGSYMPGMVGNVAEGASVAFHTEAERVELCRTVEDLAQRLGMQPEALLQESGLLRNDHTDYASGSVAQRRYGGLGMKLGAATIGGLVGGAVLPGFGLGLGAIAGSIAGGMGGGAIGGFVFPEAGMDNIRLICDLCNKQDAGQVTAADVLRLTARKATPNQQLYVEEQAARGNTNGFGMPQLDAHLAPLLGDDFYASGQTACEYVARLCNEGRLDIAQLARDEVYMAALPPRLAPQQAMAMHDVGLDEGYAGGTLPPALPPLRPGAKRGIG